jgi:DNA-binding protein H-NS
MAQRESLEKQLADAREKEQRRVLFEIVQKMREYGISLHELLGRKPEAPCAAPGTSTKAGATPIKYRDPVSGATWSGRGRVPRWIADKDRDQFLVESAQASARSRPIQVSLFSDER